MLTGITRRTLYKYLRGETADIKASHQRLLLAGSLTYNRDYTLHLLLSRLDALRAALEIALGERMKEKK